MNQYNPESNTTAYSVRATNQSCDKNSIAVQAVPKQWSATIWIAIAWIVGTLVFELNADGAAPHAGLSKDYVSLLRQWDERETDFSITHAGIRNFERIERDSKLRPIFEKLIAGDSLAKTNREQATMAANKTNKSAASPVVGRMPIAAAPTESAQKSQRAVSSTPTWSFAVVKDLVATSSFTSAKIAPTQVANKEPNAGGIENDPSVSVKVASEGAKQETEGKILGNAPAMIAETDSSTELIASSAGEANNSSLAWGEISQDLVRLVAHSFRGLMAPVHVEPLPEHSSEMDKTNSAAVVQDEVSEEENEKAGQEFASWSETQLIRTRPELLKVPTQSVVMTPLENRGHTIIQPPTHVHEAIDGASSDELSEVHVDSIPQARIAAQWPFEKRVRQASDNVSLNVDKADVRSVFEMLARGYQMNILVSPEVEGSVTANVEGLTPEQTLLGIVKMCNLNMQRDNDLIYIYPASKLPADARVLKVFPLDFVRSETLEPAVQGLLSPVGSAFSSKLDAKDNLRTQESLVVVDIPSVIAEVESYVLQADQAPRQVLIESRILEVELTDDMVYGVNFDAMLRNDLTVGAFGLADPIASKSNPLFFAQIDGSKLGALIDLVETTTDSKTLASPRVQVINGQNARIQVGQQLGFTVATVTETATIQDIQFLETGVVLSVTPTISRDNRIMMQVKPEVSDGEINPLTLLPEEETREVETSVLLDNHQGMIIGGLIQEKDRTVIRKLPWLGDVRHVGKLFQRREAVRSRSEIIVALTCHIIEPCIQDERTIVDLERTDTPLLHGVLQRNCRPWEPRLPDRAGEEKHMDVNRVNRHIP